MQELMEQRRLPMCRVVRHTMQALPSGQMHNMHSINQISRALIWAVALTIFAVPALGQATAIEPCQAAPTPTVKGSSPEKVRTRARLLPVDAGVPSDPAVEKMLAPYSGKVRELSKVVGRLEGDLKKSGVGAGSLGNFVTDGISAQAKARPGKTIVPAITNASRLRVVP